MPVMMYRRETPGPRYRALVEQHARLHAGAAPVTGPQPGAAFSGLSLLQQLTRIKALIAATGARTILDYGSGKGQQYAPLRIASGTGEEWTSVQAFWGVDGITCYDPAYDALGTLPRERSDGVVCTEVLEHCAEEDLPWIVDEIFAHAERFVFLSIACHPAKKSLPDGGNAHSTIRPPAWWDAMLRDVASRHPRIRWDAWLRLERRAKHEPPSAEQRLGNAGPAGDADRHDRLDVTIADAHADPPTSWTRTFESSPAASDDLRHGVMAFYREFGALYTFRRAVSSAAFLSGPVARTVTRPLAWVNRRCAAEAALRALLRGRRVLVLGAGSSANELETIPDDVLVLTCKLGPEILARKRLTRRLDLYYYPNIRADRAGRALRQQIANMLRPMQVGTLVCEDLLTLFDVLPLRSGVSRVLLEFRNDQSLLRRLIAPHTIDDVRGRSFCPWTSTGVRLIQYAVHFGAREVYTIGIDLGEKGYASNRVMRKWHHDDIDGNVLRILARRHDRLYALSDRSPVAAYLPVRGWQGEPVAVSARRQA